ncbi:MAG TPA: sulfatase-like hydrolase/transferase [Pyrinomonadaceae bacterium]|nr:sulfatase-like hydrolase/transferase [Pyrinomonadaceae bacterium]
MKKLGRREFIAGTAAAVTAGGAIKSSLTQAATRPNILFILADDMGWADLSCYGRPDYKTPNLDRLASQGMLFTDAYSAAPVCTPTRVGFYTGRYPARLPVGIEEPLTQRSQMGEKLQTMGIPHGHPTVASILKEAGYSTALIGKWHVGYLPNFSPMKIGFDEFFGNMSGAIDYFTHKDMTGEPDLYEAEVPVERVGYVTDLFTDRAVEYLSRRHRKPFYLSLHYTSPHWPWEGPGDIEFSRKLKRGYDGFTSGGSLKGYGEIMKSLDAAIGRVLDTLRRTGLERNTLVIFTSDNGGERFSYNWPFRGEKFDVYEGGIRVPAIVRWPGVTRARSVSRQPVITMDWTATMIAAGGARPASDYPLDGEDMTDVLRSQRRPFDRTFFWRTYKQGGMRRGKWKYVRDGKTGLLYDLSVDEHEQAELSDAHPDILKDMTGAYERWEADKQRYPKVVERPD